MMMDFIPRVMREEFEEKYQLRYRKVWKSSEGNSLFSIIISNSRIRIYTDQEVLLKKGDSSQWDITLLSLILLLDDKRNRKNFWSLSASKCDAIKSLRKIRNESIGHAPSTKNMSKEDCDHKIEEIQKALEDLLDGTKKERVLDEFQRLTEGIN